MLPCGTVMFAVALTQFLQAAPFMATHDEPSDAEIAAEAAAMYPDTNPGKPTAEEIAAEAHAIYLNRGGEHGRDMDDWLEAERRLKARRGGSATASVDEAVTDPARLP